MIRINLVAEGKKPVVAQTRRGDGSFLGLDSENIAFYALLLGFAVFIGAFAFWWWQLDSTIDENRATIREKERRVAELREFIEQVEEFERKEAELQHKITLITDLKNNQRGPVEIMDEVSRSLPELLWLDRLQQNGDAISVFGRAYNTSAIATFIENLDRVPTFDEPRLRSSQKNRSDVYDFVVTFRKVALPSEDGAAGGEDAST